MPASNRTGFSRGSLVCASGPGITGLAFETRETTNLNKWPELRILGYRYQFVSVESVDNRRGICDPGNTFSRYASIKPFRERLNFHGMVEGAVQLVNVHYFYALSKTLQQLALVKADTAVIENFSTFYFADTALREFMANELLPPQASREKCGILADLLDTHLRSAMTDPARTEPITQYEIAAIANAMREFETLLEGEYRIKPIFALSKKGLYLTLPSECVALSGPGFEDI